MIVIWLIVWLMNGSPEVVFQPHFNDWAIWLVISAFFL